MIFDGHMHLPCFEPDIGFDEKKKHLLFDMDNAEIDYGIIIADSTLNSPIGTNEECIALFNECNNIFIMAGISPLIDYDIRLAFVENNLKHGKIVAIKLYPGHELYYMNDERLSKVINLCEKHNIPLAAHTGWDNSEYNHPDFFAQIAEIHPELKLILCHMWYPNIDYCYKITEKYKNIYYDISSLADEKDKINQIVRKLSDIAKEQPDRIIFGSDYGMCSIQSHIDLVNNLDIREEYKDAIKWDNAIRIYNM